MSAGSTLTLSLKALFPGLEYASPDTSFQYNFAGNQSVPDWVQLDQRTGNLSVNAPKNLSTTLVLHIKAVDGQGHESIKTFKLVIGDARSASSPAPGRAGLSEKMANAAKRQAGNRLSMYSHG
jgi:hypothetical protein